MTSLLPSPKRFAGLQPRGSRNELELSCCVEVGGGGARATERSAMTSSLPGTLSHLAML